MRRIEAEWLGQKLPETCRRFRVPGGRIVVTVPNDYPYHLDTIDTIDTMFRRDIGVLPCR